MMNPLTFMAVLTLMLLALLLLASMFEYMRDGEIGNATLAGLGVLLVMLPAVLLTALAYAR